MKTPVETLKAARELISDPSHWIKGAFGRNASGESRWDGFAPDCVCWCAAGALEKVTGRSLPPLAMEPLQAIMGRDISTFNDSHTHAEVLAAFDAAIARLEAR